MTRTSTGEHCTRVTWPPSLARRRLRGSFRCAFEINHPAAAPSPPSELQRR